MVCKIRSGLARIESGAKLMKGFWILASVLGGLWLLSNPRCTRGCRTVAEHLLTHGIEEFLAGLG